MRISIEISTLSSPLWLQSSYSLAYSTIAIWPEAACLVLFSLSCSPCWVLSLYLYLLMIFDLPHPLRSEFNLLQCRNGHSLNSLTRPTLDFKSGEEKLWRESNKPAEDSEQDNSISGFSQSSTICPLLPLSGRAIRYSSSPIFPSCFVVRLSAFTLPTRFTRGIAMEMYAICYAMEFDREGEKDEQWK